MHFGPVMGQRVFVEYWVCDSSIVFLLSPWDTNNGKCVERKGGESAKEATKRKEEREKELVSRKRSCMEIWVCHICIMQNAKYAALINIKYSRRMNRKK